MRPRTLPFGRELRFPSLMPGRSYGFRTLPVQLRPEAVPVSRTPLPKAGGFANTLPPSRRTIDAPGVVPGREFLGRTADALDSGPGPAKIARVTPASNDGIIGRDVKGWPYDGNALLIPHQAIPRRPITVTPFARTIDTGVTVPSIGIGSPV